MLGALALSAETDTGTTTTTDQPATSGTTTTTDQPTTSGTTTTEPTSSAEDPNAGAGTGQCTVGHCYFCSTDGKNEWCSKCGNGRALNTAKGKGGRCTVELKVENCRSAPLDDPTNPEKCGECQRGYGLDKATGKCNKLELEGCTVPGLDESGKTVCKGCEGLFLKDDQSGCAEKTEDFGDIYPRNCLFGSKISEAKCLVCGHNYKVSKTGKSCPQDMVTGCDIYHPNEPQKCLLCNQAQGFYAVQAVLDEDGSVYQECKFFGKIVGVLTVAAAIVTSWL